jgi:predicted SprT family Zn-dependent metalloprotease
MGGGQGSYRASGGWANMAPMPAATRTFFWTRADGAYGTVRAVDIQDARRKKPSAKIHTKVPSWMESRPRQTSRTRKAAVGKKAAPAPKKKTSRSAAPAPAPKKKTSRSRKAATRDAAPTKKTPTLDRQAVHESQHPESETLSEQKAIALAHRLLAEWNVAGHSVEFSGERRMRRAAGLYLGQQKRILYSRLVWPMISAADQRDTVIHEVAHAIVRDRHGVGVQSHGAEWRAQMRAMGIKNPRAKLVVSPMQKKAPAWLDVTKLKPRLYANTCGCGHD